MDDILKEFIESLKKTDQFDRYEKFTPTTSYIHLKNGIIYSLKTYSDGFTFNKIN